MRGHPSSLGIFQHSVQKKKGLPRCKNLTRFSLFVSFCFAVRYCLKCFCFLCFTSSVSFTGSYTEVKPKKCPEKNKHIAQYIKTNSQPLLLFFMSPRIVSE